MEQIVYRKTLDVHKNGIQFTLQGFETADNMSRRIEISLMAGGDTIDIPLEQISALMYVTTPGAQVPSINACTIKDNKIIYDVLPIGVEGITEMQIKLIESKKGGAFSVLASPKFAVEVLESNTNESGVPETTFTALEEAIARANGVYEARLIGIELDTDCTFRAKYADGTTYESDILKELFHKGEALLSQSYARGGTGVRTGEDTDNSMYYANVSKSASAEASKSTEESAEILEEVRKQSIYTAFLIDFASGEVKYISNQYTFNINEENGELEAEGVGYTPDEALGRLINEWFASQGEDIDKLQENVASQGEDIDKLQENVATINQEFLDNTYPVGSVYVANNSSVNPATLFGGTWSLYDKEFKRQRKYIDDKEQLLDYIEGGYNEDGTISVGSNVDIEGMSLDYTEHRITITIYSEFGYAPNPDEELRLLRFPRGLLRNMGVYPTLLDNGKYESIVYTRYFTGQCDGANAISMLKVYPENDNGSICVSYADRVIQGTEITKGTEINFTFSLEFVPKNMLDDFCDKFYWKRTA